MNITWRDWWASRTIKFNLIMGAVWTAVLPSLVLLDEAQWEQIGLTKQWALIAVILVQGIERYVNNELRKRTTVPLNVRADVKP